MTGRASLSVREARADIVLEAILDATHPVHSLHDVAALPRVNGWDPRYLGHAIDDLVADGLLVEDAAGRLRALPGRRTA
jgi:hypothetical protein